MPEPASRRLVEEIARHVRDERVLEAVAGVRRDLFVPEELRAEAWENHPLPIGEGQTISQPLVVARMCEVLELRGDEKVLDVGTGSGYHAAILARLARTVVSIERSRKLSKRAAKALASVGVDNVALVVGDGSRGCPAWAPYDAISVAAACEGDIPPELERQLAEGGRLVIPVDGRRQRLVLVRRRGDEFEREPLEDVRFVPLVCDEAAAMQSIVDLVE